MDAHTASLLVALAVAVLGGAAGGLILALSDFEMTIGRRRRP